MYCGIDKSVLKKFQSTANSMDNQEKKALESFNQVLVWATEQHCQEE